VLLSRIVIVGSLVCFFFFFFFVVCLSYSAEEGFAE